ncbi:hypothetical protein SAMD00024442_6_22 [Candidatus Symbiothrix dinenymphae]|nr:hypothetical protein SAMD00024442_6_22 [Candidatus Symbiothrix dinenymphae]
MGKVIITPDELAKSAQKFRKELLVMAIIGLDTSLQHMRLRSGVRYKETVGQLTGGIEIGPYSETRIDDSDLQLVGRTLETFFGSVVKKFSPNAVYQSLYGDSIIKGDGLKNVPITQAVVAYLMKQLSKSLNANLWSAVRNNAGTTTAELFNGFDTIAATEITANKISAANKNLYQFSAAITSANAVDVLKAFYRAASDELQNEQVKLFCSKGIYNAYVDDYQATVGSVPYNREFKKTFLEGSSDMCEFVALPNKKGSPFMQLTTKQNMLVGTDLESDLEQITIEKHEAFVLQFICAMFFGCQYETIDPTKLLVGKLYVAP